MERLRHGDPDALHFDGAPDIEADPGGNAGLRHPGVDQAFRPVPTMQPQVAPLLLQIATASPV